MLIRPIHLSVSVERMWRDTPGIGRKLEGKEWEGKWLVPAVSPPTLSAVLIGRMLVVVWKCVLMFRANGAGCPCCSIFFCSSYIMSSCFRANQQHALLFPSPQEWSLGSVGRTEKTVISLSPSGRVSYGLAVRLSAGPYAAPQKGRRPGCWKNKMDSGKMAKHLGYIQFTGKNDPI